MIFGCARNAGEDQEASMGNADTESPPHTLGEGPKHPNNFAQAPDPDADAQGMQALETSPSLSGSSSSHPTTRPCSFPTPIPAAAQVATSSHSHRDDARTKGQEDGDSQLAATDIPPRIGRGGYRADEGTEMWLPPEGSPPVAMEPLEPPSGAAQHNSGSCRWLHVLATFVCCGFWQTQEQTPPDEPISVEIQENFHPEEEDDGEIPQEATISTAELLVYGEVILRRMPCRTRPSSIPERSHRISGTTEQQQRRETDAIVKQGESERQGASQLRFLQEDRQQLRQDQSGPGVGAPAGGICSTLFSSCSRGRKVTDGRASPADANRQGKGASSLRTSFKEGINNDARLQGSNNIRCRSIRRLRDESRQTWMEYQQVTLDDNSKRFQWVDVGDD